MFHDAGHCISYKDILRAAIALTKSILMTMNEDGTVIPSNLVKGRFTHFSADIGYK